MDSYFLLYLLSLQVVLASRITPRALLQTNLGMSPLLQARETIPWITFSTCGFVNGNANQAVIAPPGSICRVDTGNGNYLGRCGLSNVADYATLRCSSASPFCKIAYLSAIPARSFASFACGTQPVRETVFITASTTAPVPATPDLGTSLPAPTSGKTSSAPQKTSESIPESSSNSGSGSDTRSASASGSAANTASKPSGSKSAPTGTSGSESSSDGASLSALSPGESIFTISGSIVTSFFGQTNTVGTTVSITTTASGTTSPSPSDSTVPAPKNPPKYNFKALIGIVLGILFFLLLIVFTWIGKYRRARQKGSESPKAENPTNFFSNLPEVTAPFAKTDGLHEIYDDHGVLRELDIAGAVAGRPGRPGRVSVRGLAASQIVGGRRSGRGSARELGGDPAWGRGRISIKELDGGIFVRNGRRGEGMTQVFELDG